MNILIIDDEITQLETLRRGLTNCGYQVREATSAEEGLNILNSESSEIDLVVTDYWMPGMNGLQFLKTVRQQFGKFPVIMMSGFIEKSILISALAHDCKCILVKPFTIERLTAEIDRALNHHAAPVRHDIIDDAQTSNQSAAANTRV